MSGSDSIFHTFAARLADHLTRAAPDPAAARQAMISTIYAQATVVFGGERIYGPRTNRVERDQARERIRLALQAGEKPQEIAARERVSVRTVRRARGQVRP